MADRQTQHRRRGRAAIAVAVALGAIFASPTPSAGGAGRHYLSWESRQRPAEMRKYQKRNPAARRFKVGRDRIARLRKSTFWNKRPYQFSTPLIAGDRLFVGVDAARFYAIDIPREKKLWEFVTEGPVQGKAAQADGTVYVGDSKAFVYALDAQGGAERWRARLDTEILAQPLVAAGRLYVVDLSGRLYALDRATGAEIWHTPPAERGVGFSVRRASSPVEVAGKIVFGTSSGTLIASNASDGSIAWVRQIGDRQSQVYDVDSAPLPDGGRIYASSADGTLACLDASTGGVLWTAETGGANDLLLHGGRLYATGGGVLSSLDPESGGISWQQDFKTPEISSPVAGEHYVAVVSTVDKLYLVDSESGDIAYDRFVRRGSFGDPAVDGENLYVLSNSGRLYSFRVRELPPKPAREKKGKREGESL